MSRRAVPLLLLMASVVWMSGCGGGDGDDDDNGDGGMDPGTPLIGFWQPIDAAENPPVPVATALGWASSWTNATYRFNQDGTAVREAFVAGTSVDVSNGTWMTDEGAGYMEFDGVRTTITDSRNFMRVATVDVSRGGRNFTVRMAQIVSATGHDTNMVGTWKINSVSVDGVGVPLGTFFGMAAGSDTMTVQLFTDGRAIGRELDSDRVVDRGQGTWATAGVTAVASVPEPLNWLERSIFEPSAMPVVTFFDRQSGQSVRIQLGGWAPAETRDAALVGTWQATSATRGGLPAALNDIFDSTPGTTAHFVTFYADGTMEQRAMAGVNVDLEFLNWWWTPSAGQLRLDSIDPDPVMEFSYAIVGTQLSVNFTDNGVPVSIVFTKQ